MKLLFTIFLTSAIWLQQQQPQRVIICTGSMSHSYHRIGNDSCPGKINCTRSLDSISVDSALTLHRIPCGYCYPKK